MKLDPADLEELRLAVSILETPGLGVRLTHMVGSQVNRAIEHLPKSLSEAVQDASSKAIAQALKLAISTMDVDPGRRPPANATHKVLSGLSGAMGGFFGVPALVVELPVSTTIMLRSIADIARSEGEDLSDLNSRLACLQVFALGGRHPSDDETDTGYFAVRAALANAVSEATRYLAQRQLIDEGAPVLVRLVASIASRFGIIVSEKFALQTFPMLGALGGAAINLTFIAHFQAMAKGHFIVRRLERVYGTDAVELAYERLRMEA